MIENQQQIRINSKVSTTYLSILPPVPKKPGGVRNCVLHNHQQASYELLHKQHDYCRGQHLELLKFKQYCSTYQQKYVISWKYTILLVFPYLVTLISSSLHHTLHQALKFSLSSKVVQLFHIPDPQSPCSAHSTAFWSCRWFYRNELPVVDHLPANIDNAHWFATELLQTVTFCWPTIWLNKEIYRPMRVNFSVNFVDSKFCKICRIGCIVQYILIIQV